MDGSALSSPMESPEVPINSSVGTLQSVETSSIRRQVRLLHGKMAFFDTSATCPNEHNPQTSPSPQNINMPCRVRISSDESVFSEHDEAELASSGVLLEAFEEIQLGEEASSHRSPMVSTNSTAFFSSGKGSVGNSTRPVWSNKSSETPSTLDSSSFYNRSPVDEVFDVPKYSLGEPASPSAILTPSTEISDESGSSDDRVFDLRDDLWDVSQFDYDLSSLNIDGMSQLSGNFNF